MTIASIRIRTGARLHFGPLSYHPRSGRHFGGVGLMIQRPGLDLTLTTPPSRTRFGISSPRGEALLKSILSKNPDLNVPVQMDLKEEIPSHSGLGSGTQLSLGITEALLRWQGRSTTGNKLAERCGRGLRSAIGLYGYEQGGFLLDAGHAPGEVLGTLAAREQFPPQWRVLLLRPNDAQGLHGSVEMQAFHQLGPMPEEVSGRLCRLALTEMLPALSSQNFLSFATSLFEYGQLAGEFFSGTQGGVFASPRMRAFLKEFDRVEETGMAQSSWGPTIAMLAENEDHANELRRRIWATLPSHQCQVEITSARNHGRELLID